MVNSLIETKNIGNSGGTDKNIYRILKGIGLSFLLTIVFIFIFSCILTFSNISEKTVAPVLIIISSISILAGSSVSTMKINKHGLLNGGSVGVIYMILIYLLSSAVTGVYSLTIMSAILLIAGIMAGAVGGIIGVNLK